MREVIQTKRLILKPLSESDRDQLRMLLTNDEIGKTFVVPDFKHEEVLREIIDTLLTLSLSKEHFQRGIFLDDRLIGIVNDVEIQDHIIELGYAIHPSYQNKGYATEMLNAVIVNCFDSDFLVTAGAFVENVASMHVMQACGMRKTEKEVEFVYRDINRHCFYYAIHRDDRI